MSFVTALAEFVSRAAGGGSAALATGCAALEIDASMVLTRDRFVFFIHYILYKVSFCHSCLSQVCVNLLIQTLPAR